MYYSFTLREFLSRSTAAAGNYAYVTDLDVRHDVSVAPGVDYASGTLGLGLAKISSSPPESPINVPLTFCCCCRFTSSILTSYRDHLGHPYRHPSSPSSPSSLSIPSSSGTPIFLFYVIGFFFIYKIIFLFFFQNVQS
jgi:hypothetical protein